MSTPRTRLYLDVDGVINANNPELAWGHKDLVNEGTAVTGGYKYRIRWHTMLIDCLKSLDVDLVWTTTWQESAVETLAPLIDYGHEGRVLAPLSGQVSFPSIFWKEDAIREEQLRDPSPFIWFEDEVTPYQVAEFEGMGGFVRAPSAIMGISSLDCKAAKKYLDKIAREA